MKAHWQSLGLAGLVWMSSVQPVLAQVDPVAQAGLVSVTGIQLLQTDQGIQLELVTADGSSPTVFTSGSGKILVLDVLNAQGSRQVLTDPVAGIASVILEPRTDTSMRVTVLGREDLPPAQVLAGEAGVVVALGDPLVVSEPPPATIKVEPNPTPAPTSEPALTQPAPEDLPVLELGEVIVTATRTAEPVGTVSRSVTVIDRDQIEQQAALGSDFRQILGQLVPGFGPPTSVSTPRSVIQELRGRETAILINGLPVTSNYGLDRELRTIDPSTVERVEVVRGPTAVYGSQATGGVINIITSTPDSGSLMTTLSADVDGSLTHSGDSLSNGIQLSLSGDNGTVDYVLSLRRQETGGAFDAEGDRIPETSGGGILDAESYAFLGSLGYQIDSDQEIRFTLNYYDGRQDTIFLSDPAVTDEPGTQKARPLEVQLGLEGTDLAGDESFLAGLSYTHNNILNSRVVVNLYYRDYTSIVGFSDFRGGFFDVIGRQRAMGDKWGLQIQAETPLSPSARLLWGIDYVDENNQANFEIFDPTAFDTRNTLRKIEDRTFVPPYSLDQLGLFAQIQWEIDDQWRLNGGLRYEKIGLNVESYNTFFEDPILGGNLDFNATVFNLGTSYDLTPRVTAFASFAQGFSVPGLGGVLRNPPEDFTSVADNLKLTEPIKVNNYEVGIRGSWSSLQTTLAAFYNTSDLGEDYTFSGGVSQLVRAPERIYGIEATADWQVATDWLLGGTLSWTEGENDEDNDGDFLPISTFRIQPLKLTAYVENQTLPNWRNRLQALYSGSRDRAFNEDVDAVAITEYTVVDLISTLDLEFGRFQLGVENLFNTQYFPVQSQFLSGFNEVFNAAGEGRTIRLTYSTQF